MGQSIDAIEGLEAITGRFPPAYNALAGIYFRGDGVPVDRQKALRLWRKGASLGHLGAKRDLLHELIHGRYGVLGRVEGVFKILPLAIEIVSTRNRHGDDYTDRLR
jgi:TPR repeat protein